MHILLLNNAARLPAAFPPVMRKSAVGITTKNGGRKIWQGRLAVAYTHRKNRDKRQNDEKRERTEKPRQAEPTTS